MKYSKPLALLCYIFLSLSVFAYDTLADQGNNISSTQPLFYRTYEKPTKRSLLKKELTKTPSIQARQNESLSLVDYKNKSSKSLVESLKRDHEKVLYQQKIGNEILESLLKEMVP